MILPVDSVYTVIVGLIVWLLFRFDRFVVTKRFTPPTSVHSPTGSSMTWIGSYAVRCSKNVDFPQPMLPSTNTVNDLLLVFDELMRFPDSAISEQPDLFAFCLYACLIMGFVCVSEKAYFLSDLSLAYRCNAVISSCVLIWVFLFDLVGAQHRLTCFSLLEVQTPKLSSFLRHHASLFLILAFMYVRMSCFYLCISGNASLFTKYNWCGVLVILWITISTCECLSCVSWYTFSFHLSYSHHSDSWTGPLSILIILLTQTLTASFPLFIYLFIILITSHYV